MTHKIDKLWYVVGFLAVAALMLWLSQYAQRASGSAPIGLNSTIADYSSVLVGPSLNGITVLIHSSQNCAARVITTNTNRIVLRFSSSTPSNGVATATPTVSDKSFNVLQAASTTVAYDGGIYGCSGISAYGFDATNTVYFMELR